MHANCNCRPGQTLSLTADSDARLVLPFLGALGDLVVTPKHPRHWNPLPPKTGISPDAAARDNASTQCRVRLAANQALSRFDVFRVSTSSLYAPHALRYAWPSWAVSLLAHACLLGWLWLAQRPVVGPRSVEAGPDRVVGLVSREFQKGPVEQQSTDEAEAASSSGVTSVRSDQSPANPSKAPQTGAEAVASEAPPVSLDVPTPTKPVRSGLGMGAPPRETRALLEDNSVKPVGTADAGTSDGDAGDGRGRKTSFFGASARGQRIVYVLDASGSMLDFGAIDVAKQELKASLERLAPDQQFQILFYNNTPRPMIQLTARDDLPRATDTNKARARQFIDSLQPQLGTNHFPALELALSYTPDVLFLLTDADFPRLSARDLDLVRKRNNGACQIHTVEFGKGGDLSADDNFLKKLARQNGGQHRYRDVYQFQANR